MLKKLLIIGAVIAASTQIYGQGTVQFNTLALGTADTFKIRDNMGALLSGTSFRAQLYAVRGSGMSEGSLVPVGIAVGFRTLANAGFVQTSGNYPDVAPPTGVNATVTVFGPPGGEPVTLQVRAWSAGFASYEAALASNDPSKLAGKSLVFSLQATGNPQSSPPGPPPVMNGFQGFGLSPIPEPSVIALGIIGLGTLVMLRRRK